MSATVVIGAGMAGLVRAHALARGGEEVRLLEAADRPGGVVRSERVEGFLLELGPNTVRPTPELWSLVTELGLEREALLADPRLPRFIDFDGRLYGLSPSPFALLATRLLSARGKLRLLGEPFAGRGDERESVRSFFQRRLGREAAERLIEPFVSGVWAGDASCLSAAAAFPGLVRWEREHGSLLKGALASRRRGARAKGPKAPKGLLSFRGGLETLPRALASRLGAVFHPGTSVRRINPSPGGWRLETSRGTLEAKQIVVAAPAGEAARLLEPFDAGAAEALGGIPQPPLAVLHLVWPAEAFPAPLAGFGHLVVPRSGRRILGAVWSSCLFADRAPRGQVLLTAFAGGSRDPEAPALPDGELARIAETEIAESLGSRGAPRLLRVTRYAHALPQYDLDHEARMRHLEECEARWKGLSLLGSYRGGLSVGDVVRSAFETPWPSPSEPRA